MAELRRRARRRGWIGRLLRLFFGGAADDETEDNLAPPPPPPPRLADSGGGDDDGGAPGADGPRRAALAAAEVKTRLGWLGQDDWRPYVRPTDPVGLSGAAAPARASPAADRRGKTAW